MKPASITIKRILVRNGPFEYYTHQVEGLVNGRRVRRQFKTIAEAAGEKNRLEVDAANAQNDVRAVNTRLAPAQLADAESAFRRLAGRPLALAIDWFLTTYREPSEPTPLPKAAEECLTASRPHSAGRQNFKRRRKLATMFPFCSWRPEARVQWLCGFYYDGLLAIPPASVAG